MTNMNSGSYPEIVSETEWLKARKALLEKEKKVTQLRDDINAERRKMPVTEIEKAYRFEGPDGKVTLHSVFEGRKQLIIHHFMFDPNWEKGCPSCTFFENEGPYLPHLHQKGVTYAVISRAPFEKIDRYRQAMGWSVPWYSSYGSDFNYDFHVTMDESVGPVMYNYRDKAAHENNGMPWYTKGEQPGVSVFLRDRERIFHTYSTYARGVEPLVATPNYLDLTPLGRQDGS